MQSSAARAYAVLSWAFLPPDGIHPTRIAVVQSGLPLGCDPCLGRCRGALHPARRLAHQYDNMRDSWTVTGGAQHRATDVAMGPLMLD